MLLIGAAWAVVVPTEVSWIEAVLDPTVELIEVEAGMDLSLEDPQVIDRDLTIQALGDGVVLPPLAGAFADLVLTGVSVEGVTTGFAQGSEGTLVECPDSCTLFQYQGSLSLNQVTLEGSTAGVPLHVVDADVVFTDLTVTDSFPDEYSVLIATQDRSVSAHVDNLEFTDNRGPFKLYDAAETGMTVTVEDSTFVGNEAWIASGLYLWGVDDFAFSNLYFEGEEALDPARGALHLTESSGVISATEFASGRAATALSETGDMAVEVYGLNCFDTYGGDGGCLGAFGLGTLSLFNVWVDVATAEGWGGAVFAEGPAGSVLYLEGGVFMGTSADLNGGALAIDGMDTTVWGSRFCGTYGDEGSALYLEDARLAIAESAFQGTGGGPTLFTANAPFGASNLTFVGGEDHFIDGRPDNRNWHVTDSIFYGGQRVTSTGEGPSMLFSYNLFGGGAGITLDHGDGFIQADPLFVDQDLYDCYTDLRPGPGSPAIDGDPTLPEPDGTGVRDLGWYVGQERDWEDSGFPDSGGHSGDSATGRSWKLGPASGGCATAPLAPLPLLGLLLALGRRRSGGTRSDGTRSEVTPC